MKETRVGKAKKHTHKGNENRQFHCKKERSLLSRRNELMEVLLCWQQLLQHKICLELGDKVQPDPHIRCTRL